jgi:hypothetical protein
MEMAESALFSTANADPEFAAMAAAANAHAILALLQDRIIQREIRSTDAGCRDAPHA